MGIQASTIKTAAGKFTFEPKKKGVKVDKVRIGILAFEVANVMSKSAQLWQSLTDQEVRRFRTEVIKSEGVLNLVSDNESVLLSLACMEKLQDLTAVALAVSRLGKRCNEAVLVGFEHIYNDILKHNIDVRELEFPHKEMEAKVKKMERYICSTSNLYQELEVLAEMEQALRRLQEEDDPAQKDNVYALEQKVVWQRQEIKYLKEISLWNHTYDKVVGILARSVCTLYGRIIRVFGYPIIGWPQILSVPRVGDAEFSGSTTSCLTVEEPKLSNGSANSPISPILPGRTSCGAHPPQSDVEPYLNNRLSASGPPLSNMRGQSLNASTSNGLMVSPPHQSAESYIPLSLCFSPGRQFSQQRSSSANYESRADESIGSSPMGTPYHDDFTCRGRDSGIQYLNSEPVGPFVSQGTNKFLFDPKVKLQNAPPSTLGGSALALHYSNVIIIVEKMVRYPHLISQDARDDLYHMLPKNVRMSLRARLRACMRSCESPECDDTGTSDWKEILERVLGWLAPLAHNMIRWQSEHNFEQLVVSRTNVLLLQTLYFANQVKAEAAIVELLVGLNYLWRHDRDSKANSLMEYASNRDLDEYLEWQL